MMKLWTIAPVLPFFDPSVILLMMTTIGAPSISDGPSYAM
jgi:hypothetical protein